MSEHQAEIVRLWNEASGLPNGPVKIALLEEAVRLADFGGDEDDAYGLRIALIDTATFSGRPDIALVAFAWCLAQFDRAPDRYDEHDLMWKYKWIVDSTVDFYAISRAQADQLLADMARRFNAYGAPHAVLTCGRYNALWSGRHDQARIFDTEAQKARRDMLSDCAACIVKQRIEFLVETGRTDAAISFFEKKVTSSTRCSEEPHRLLAHMLLPYWRVGKLEEAQKIHERGYKLVANDAAFVQTWGYHIGFLGLTGQTAKLRRLVPKHIEAGLAAVNLFAKHEFLVGATLAMKRLELSGAKTLKLTTAEPLDVASSANGYETGALGEWFLCEARRIGDGFDARNGNTFYRDRLTQRLADFDTAVDRGDALE